MRHCSTSTSKAIQVAWCCWRHTHSTTDNIRQFSCWLESVALIFFSLRSFEAAFNDDENLIPTMAFKHYVIHVLRILFAINILFASQSCNFFSSYLPIWFSLLKAICYPRGYSSAKVEFFLSLAHTMAVPTNKSCYAKHSFNRLPHHRTGEMALTRCC